MHQMRSKAIMNKLIFVASIVAIIPVLIMATIANVYASGVRGDVDDDATEEEIECWVNGYDDGFAGKYDKDRGSECEKIGDDNYNYTWTMGCKESGLTAKECEHIRD